MTQPKTYIAEVQDEVDGSTRTLHVGTQEACHAAIGSYVMSRHGRVTYDERFTVKEDEDLVEVKMPRQVRDYYAEIWRQSNDLPPTYGEMARACSKSKAAEDGH